MASNPLASTRVQAPAPPAHPMQRHADIWKHVNAQTPETLQSHVESMDHILPVLGQLAGDPKVTAKDVIKAATNGVAAGALTPSAAVETIADMPADPEKLRPWLKDRYATALAVTVHAKAALMGQADMAAAARAQATQPGMQQPGMQQPGAVAQPTQPMPRPGAGP
jgi:hypothetical protein